MILKTLICCSKLFDKKSLTTRFWIWQTMKHEYENAEKQPDYRHFIKGNFGSIG